METANWRPSSGASDDTGGHNINFTNPTWHIWDITTRYDPIVAEARVVHALLFGDTGVDHCMPDPHMMCLKLGKRHYCKETVVPDPAAESSATVKRGKPQYPYYVTDTATMVPKCQVEGCHVALGNAKEYYRKHKVCELHSKAPKVVVLGIHQRFCQQCSRFHVVTEFDEAKRSCRRRLKGHNQRRRKGTHSMMERRLGPLPPPESQSGYARSLLSSPDTEAWNFSGDLSSRCSVALYELIAANRATSVSGHFLNQNTYHHSESDTQMWDRFGHTTTTPELKQAPALEFGRLSMKERSKDPEEWTDYSWSSFGDANVV